MSAKTARTVTNLFNLIVIISMMFGPLTALPVQAYTETDKEDYAPGSVVTVYGDNRDGAGYLPGETVQVTVTQPVSAEPLTCEGIADENGAWSCQLKLSSDPVYAVGLYAYVTLGLTSGVSETHSFTDANPSANLAQCANDPIPSLSTDGCNTSATQWENGNLNQAKSVYLEGDSIPYRMLFDNLSLSSHTVIIEWDTTQGGKHAIDYLTTFNRTVANANPCLGVDGCNLASYDTEPIPADPQVTEVGVTPVAGLFTLYGGMITAVSDYSYPVGTGFDGNKSAQIAITFTASVANPVLAWGGHIAERKDWGNDGSAVAISGSPFHMRLIDLDGKGGNQDRSLSTEAVIYPASITIIKEATPEESTEFPFTASPAPLADFKLVDDGTTTNTQLFGNITNFTNYTVTENTPAGWTFGMASCSVTSANGGSQTVNGATVTINLKEGEKVTCTYTNTRNYDKDLTVSKTATASLGRTYKWLIDKSVDKTEIDIAQGGTARFNYSVKVTPDGYDDSAWAVSGKITVANPNAFAVSGVNVTDAIDNGGNCSVTSGTNVTVPASGSVELDYSCTYAAAPSKAAGTNTATATWTLSDLYSEHTSASGTASVDFSAVTPSETNKSITVVDDKTDPQNLVTLGTWNWADGEHSFTYALDKSGVAGTCTEYTNTAVIDETDQSDSQTVKVCVGKDLTVEKTATASLNRTYKWLIDKSVDETLIKIADGGTATVNYSVKITPDGFADSGWTLGGTITISNPNDWEDITVNVADTLDKGGTCTITEEAPHIVPKDGLLTLNYTCASDGTTTKNTATITWDKAVYFTPNNSVSADAAVSFGLALETNKTITVIDDKTDPANPVTLGTSDYYEGPFEYNYSLDKSGVAGTCTDYTNIAVIKETNQSDDQKVTVCVGLDLSVAKTVKGTFNRAYLWSISKDVDKTSVNIANGGSATFHYTVDVTQTGISDSGWTLSGKITVTNPNDWEDITADVTDSFDGGGICNVTGGEDVVIAASGSVTLDYSCEFSSEPIYAGKNTATATWDSATYFTPTGTDSGEADVTLALSSETNRVITVVDDQTDPLNPVTLGTSDYYSGPFEFTYSLEKQGIAGECTDFTNTAVIDETDQSDVQTVTVCVGKDLTVEKTAVPTFTRTWEWTITKDFDASYTMFAGQDTDHGYKVTVTPESTDSLWKVDGVITISNPNAWEAITLTSLADVVDNGGDCTIDEGPYVIPASGSLDVNYTCTYTSAPSNDSGNNTATATWDSAAYFTPTGTASGDKSFIFENPTEINPVITVDDDNLTNEFWSADRAYAEWTYDKNFACSTDPADYTDGTYSYSLTNTATINETGDSDTATVDVTCLKPQLKVNKTVNGLPFSGPELTFQLRQGASMTSFGTTLETKNANLGNNGQVVFDTILLPGTYQLVELIPVGYVPSYVWGTYGVEWFRPGYEPGQGGQDPQIWVAVNFVVNSDGTITFQPGPAQQIIELGGIVDIDNQVGQMPFTIGYWKNHASSKESNGSQDPVLDQMLYKATQAGQTIKIGKLELPGGSTPNNAGTSATYAVRLLNKSTIDTNKKMASDPAFNSAAQLLGYRLNTVFGSWLNPVADLAAITAQTMLWNVGFNGKAYSKPSKATFAKWTANMNYLAMVLDSYNNGTLVLTTLTMPYPNVGY